MLYHKHQLTFSALFLAAMLLLFINAVADELSKSTRDDESFIFVY